MIACNIFINSAVEYFFWSNKFTSRCLKEMDLAISNIMNKCGAKHTNLMNSVVYLPREKGGIGLKSLEQSYKEIKIKVATKFINTEDRRMLIVRQFHEINLQKSHYSILKEANNYLEEFDLEFKIVSANSEVYFICNNNVGKIEIDQKCISTQLIKKRNESNINQLLKSNWQGLNYKLRIEDDSINKKYFKWLKNWKSCPTSVIMEFCNLFYQTLSTLCYKQGRCSNDINNTTCRLCNERQESVKHLMSNCSYLARTAYKSRHDNALKCFVAPLLKQLKLCDRDNKWYSSNKIKPYYENRSCKFWWDIPEYSGKEDESCQLKPLRPDGKLEVMDGESKKIFLIEMSVPWICNREDKLKEKINKYENILIQYRLEYPDYQVDQITLIKDVFGGYDQQLIGNIGKIIEDKS